ncbi:MAG: Asp-tRNA(Asn)/Glu-tRNA(Gln) amidotransferase subunit GatC [Candidatus Omnitrophota bacterium]
MKKSGISIEINAIEQLATLARIRLSIQEARELSCQLQDILDFIGKLGELDIKDIPPTSHILPINNILREDNPSGSLTPDNVLKNAPSREGDFFIVPKVIE